MIKTKSYGITEYSSVNYLTRNEFSYITSTFIKLFRIFPASNAKYDADFVKDNEPTYDDMDKRGCAPSFWLLCRGTK